MVCPNNTFILSQLPMNLQDICLISSQHMYEKFLKFDNDFFTKKMSLR